MNIRFPLQFDNRFIRQLPADSMKTNTLRQVENACYSLVEPEPVRGPALVAHAQEVANLLDLSEDVCRSQSFADVFAGNRLLPGMEPYAVCYGGHQFGHWAGQLGDGRAISLGEVKNQRDEHWEIQLKGAGPTPYSRSADGRAVLRSSVREFLCSEAMHHLGVPTTRALSLVTTGENIIRDILYDGHPRPEPGAVVCRVAPTFLRFGNFQMLAVRGETDNLKTLADFTIENFFPHLGTPTPDVYGAFFREVCERTAHMIIHWMRVGFVHGVMNTDNMSILGLTIDYGPYGWLDNFDPTWTPNTTDRAHRRYRYGAQPPIALWNLNRLAEALLPLVPDGKILEEGLLHYIQTFETGQRSMLLAKIGLSTDEGEADGKLIEDLLDTLQNSETDMTLFFRLLADLPQESESPHSDYFDILRPAFYDEKDFHSNGRSSMDAWMERYRTRLESESRSDEERRAAMNRANPKYVMRNYLAQLAIDDAEQGNPEKVRELLEVMRHPYDDQPQYEVYAEKRPDWARNKPGCSMLSCSS
jgi:serine/tyrosine/threonine adenylyltransferase